MDVFERLSRYHNYGRLCARFVVTSQPDNRTIDGRIDQSLDRGRRFLEGAPDIVHDAFYDGVREIVYSYEYGCEGCGADFERPTVGTLCRKCIIEGWVRGAIPAEDVEAFDVARESVA